MTYTTLRVSSELWERIKTHAATVNKSSNAAAVECISDCLDEMDKKTPGVPKIVQVYHLLKKKG